MWGLQSGLNTDSEDTQLIALAILLCGCYSSPEILIQKTCS